MDFETAKAVCRTFPGVVEDVKWGEVAVFSVGLKMFACSDITVPAARISFKADPERFLELTDRPGIIPAPYMARIGWVCANETSALSDDEAVALLRRAYDIIFAKLSKKLQKEIGESQ
jgi:predicted DNA-binding protein (MmcQ/YjbR family)